MNESKGLLVLRLKTEATAEAMEDLLEVIGPTAEALGVEPMVLPPSVDVALQMDYTSLLVRLCVAVEALVAQGEPSLGEGANVAQNAPQGLNTRSVGLNSRG